MIHLIPILGVLFGCLVCSGLYINKYVLSVLGFKYPTIFQGWQTLAGLIIYAILTYASKSNFKLVGIDRPAFISLLPGFLFYTTSLVAASKALAGNAKIAIDFGCRIGYFYQYLVFFLSP